MTFLNPLMLLGAVAVAAPLILHLLNRRQARVVLWGAMRFLLASVAARNRRILLEEILLLLVRCAIPLLLAIAMARPLLVAGRTAAFLFTGAGILAALGFFAAAGAFWSRKKRRLQFLLAAFITAAAAGAGAFMERLGTTPGGGGFTDYALVLDASTSMALVPRKADRSNYETAVAAATTLVGRMKPGDTACVILAGPAPTPLIAAPTYDHKALLRALAGCREPLGGVANLPRALDVATDLLEKGRNPHRIILVYSDGQRNGWHVNDAETWRYLGRRFSRLAFPARVLVRTFPLPTLFTNLAAADLRFSRDIIGTDRPVSSTTTLRNTGAVPVRPDAVEIEVGGRVVQRRAGTTAVPAGARRASRFRYRFPKPGLYLVRARIHVADDFPADNTVARVTQVLQTLPILLVDGMPALEPLGGAATFMDIALRPAPAENRPAGKTPRPPDRRRILRTLAAPRVVDAGTFAADARLGNPAVVVLAGVRSLPENAARRLAAFVRDGGGLLLVPGRNADPAFYQAWRTEDGEAVCPMHLGAWREAAGTPLALDPDTLRTPAPALLRRTLEDNPNAIAIQAYRALEPRLDAGENVQIDGRLSNHAVFMAEKNLGRGLVVLLAVPLRPEAGNLPLLPAFVPFMDRLVTHLAAAGGLARNLNAGQQAVFRFRRTTSPTALPTGAGPTGLLGEYFAGRSFETRRLVRVDRRVDFDWGRNAPAPKLPADHFSIRWSGWVRAPITGPVTFSVLSDDGCRLRLGNKILVDEWKDQYPTEYTAVVTMAKDRFYPIVLEYYENEGDSVIRLRWAFAGRDKAPVPGAALRPAPTPGMFTVRGPENVTPLAKNAVNVRTPHGRTLPARAEVLQGDLRVSFDHTDVPGVYRLRLSPGLAALYGAPSYADPGLPFVVRRSADESVLERLSPADHAKLAALAPISWTKTPEALDQRLFGEIRGRDVTGPLLVSVLVLAVLEVALTRWIALRRRSAPGAAPAAESAPPA